MARCPPKSEYDQAWDGEWFDLTGGFPFFLSCCDCGLVHKVEARIDENGKIQLRLTQERRRTGQLRRHHEYNCVPKGGKRDEANKR